MGNGITGNWSGYASVSVGNASYWPLIGGTRWTSGTLNYSIPTGTAWHADPYSDSNEWATWAPVPSSAQWAIHAVLDDISRLVNLDFQFIADTQTQAGDLRFALTGALDADQYLGWAYYPGGHASAGDVWFAAGQYRSSGSYYSFSPAVGNWDYTVVIHEIGHALGLDHPFDNDASWATSRYAPLHFSVMNYGSYGGGTYSINPTSLSVLDVRALWSLYGQNTTASAGNDTYTFTEGGKYLQVLWDAGGTDTIDYSASTSGGVIDLTPNSWSRMGSPVTRDGARIYNIYTIDDGRRSTADIIENAIGGAGADRILGNTAANWLRGGGGNDSLTGHLGNDRLDGGTGADRMAGGQGNDVYTVDNTGDRVVELLGRGIDTIRTSVTLRMMPRNVENLVLTGRAALAGIGNGLNNTITGNAGRNVLSGGGGNDLLLGGLGVDRLTGGAGRDRFRFLSLRQTGDTITDFTAAADRLEFRAAAFGGLPRGALAAGAFQARLGAGDATRAGVRFVFNRRERALYYDGDGLGGAAAVRIVSLGNAGSIGAANIVLV